MKRSMWLAMGLAAFVLTAGARAQAPPGSDVLVLRPPTATLRSASWNSEKLVEASEVVECRLRQIGIASPSVTLDSGANTLTVGIPAGKSAAGLASLLTRPAVLEFRYVKQLDNGTWMTRPDVVNGRQTGTETIYGADGRPVPARALAAMFATPPAFSGADLMPNCSAELSHQSLQSQYFVVVRFEFKDAAKAKFEASTRSHIGKILAIFLDRQLICDPKINDAIPGIGIIEGHWTVEDGKQLAAQLNSGALPIPLEVVRRPAGH